MTADVAARLIRPTFRFPTQTVVYVAVFLTVVVFVLYPILTIVVNSFRVGAIGSPQSWGLDGWRAALSEPAMTGAILNTMKVLLANELISFPAAIGLAWLLGRTDLPGRGVFEFMFWITFFLPSLAVTLGWILLLDPHHGIINVLLKKLPFIDGSVFNIYSFWGVVWAHLSTASIAVKVMLLTPAFRNVDTSFEEAARVTGATRFKTALLVTIPLVMPAILTVLALSLIRAIQTFEIEMVLGPPFHFWVYGTKVYTLVAQVPPEFQAATAMATIGFILITPLVFFHRWLLTRKDYTSVTGRIRTSPVLLGAWRIPAFCLVALVIFVITILPICFLVMGSFMTLFGYFDIDGAWTLDNWKSVFENDFFVAAIWNTAYLAVGTGLAAVIFCALVAHFVVRSRFAGKGILDFLSWMPFAIPGILFGVGLLYVVLSNPVFRALYGGVGLLILAAVVGHMTLGIQILKAAMLQLGPELEEAARTTGATWWYGFRKVMMPILTPTLILVGIINFIGAARDISTVALLATNATRTLALLQLDHMVDGRWEAAAVISAVVVALTVTAALLARLLGLRLGIHG